MSHAYWTFVGWWMWLLVLLVIVATVRGLYRMVWKHWNRDAV